MTQFHDYAQFLHDLPPCCSEIERAFRFHEWTKQNAQYYQDTSKFMANVLVSTDTSKYFYEDGLRTKPHDGGNR